MKKSSELGTTSDLVVVHTLICSLQGVSTIGLRNQTRQAQSFKIGHQFALQQCQFPFSRKIHSNASNCIELDSQRIIHQFEALKLSSYSLKFKLISVNVEEILTGLELRCIQRHLIVGQQTKMTSRGQKMWNASRFCVSSLRRGHANLLCIVPILVYVLPKQVHLGEQKIVAILRNFKVSAADVGTVFIKGRKYILRVSKPALLYQAWILSLENAQIANLSLIFAVFETAGNAQEARG